MILKLPKLASSDVEARARKLCTNKSEFHLVSQLHGNVSDVRILAGIGKPDILGLGLSAPQRLIIRNVHFNAMAFSYRGLKAQLFMIKQTG